MELIVDRLEFEYSPGNKILDGISFRAESGDFISLIGRNGSGKSTLFKCILNRLNGYSGTVLVDNKDTRSLKKRELSEYFAYVPQANYSVFDYTVMDMVLMGTVRRIGYSSSPSDRQVETAKTALKTLEIEYLADKNINHISGGERQLVYIARALAQNAEVILMDEPTSALDFSNRNKVIDYSKKLTEQGYIIIMITHDPSVPLCYTEKVLALNNGKVEAFGKSDEVLTEDLLYLLYGEKIRDGEIEGHRVFYREVF